MSEEAVIEETVVRESVVKVEEPKNEKKTEVSSYRQQKIAMSGMGFLLQQMRSASSSTTVVRNTVEQVETPPVLERKKPIRPVAVEYKQLSGPGVIQLEPFQVIQDCFNEGSTPKFNFAPNCKENNYVRSCKFSSTGTHLVTDSEDRRIRIFELDEEDKAHLKKSILNGDLIYDVVWDPFGEQFATTSSGSPIKLWDCDGELTSTYHGINHMDELDFAYCVAFNSSGEKIYAGYKGVVRLFDIGKPGRQVSEMKTFVKGQSGQRTILSCIDMSPSMDGVFAIGSFNSCVGLYSDYTNSCDLLIPTQNRYITCLKYSADGTRLYVGGRNSSSIECYDIRHSVKLLAEYSRPVTNGQRVIFKIDPEDRYLFSGSSLGDIRVFDLKTSSNSTNLSVEPAWTCLNASKCTISSVDLHPSKAILATTCGQRVFPIPLNDDDEDLENRMDTTDEYSVSKSSFDNSLKISTMSNDEEFNEDLLDQDDADTNNESDNENMNIVSIVNENSNADEAEVDEENENPTAISALLENYQDEENEKIEPHVELPHMKPIQPLLDPAPVVSEPIQSFRPPNWRGLMAALQNEPIDPVQLGKDIFEETQGSDAKYKCILNGLAGRPFRLDLPTLYQRRTELVKRLGGDEDTRVQLYDFSMGCIAKMDVDRRAFNNVASIVNQNIFFQTINGEKIPEQYKFNPSRMREMIFFTPVEVEEYKTTNSAQVLNAVVSLELEDQEEIAKKIAFYTYTSCVKPEYLGKMSISTVDGKRGLMKEFFTFLYRILYQSFGLPYQKFIGLKMHTLTTGLPSEDYPYERATAVLLMRMSVEAIKDACHEYTAKPTDDSDHSESNTKKRGRKRRKESDPSE